MKVEEFIEHLRRNIAAMQLQYGLGMPVSLSMLSDLLEKAASGEQPPTKEQLEYGLPGKKMERRTPYKHANPWMASQLAHDNVEVRMVRSLEEENKALAEGFSVPAKNPYFR